MPRQQTFYAPEGTSECIYKSHRPSVRYKSCLSHNSETTEANLMKLHRKIKNNKKVCRAQELGFYAQEQGHNRGRGRIPVSAITLGSYAQDQGHNRGRGRIPAITQKLLKQI